MLYEQLLRTKIIEAQKRLDNLTVFFAFWDVKAAHRILMKLTQGVNFINILVAAF